MNLPIINNAWIVAGKFVILQPVGRRLVARVSASMIALVEEPITQCALLNYEHQSRRAAESRRV